ncbi:MAG: hypothetical protein EHM54_03160 [Nitrospiraceae bacterium]|nr:MAG: hypothetical protein EHM54_03160 [Nitrospiraceae bacterium]
MKKCPYLREWLIASCVAEEPACVVLPFVLRDYCKTGKFEDCPLQPRLQVQIPCRVGLPGIS